jgi:phosphotransferase system  glucose/maltose/N-acetylglucosamine-specific IIC component
VGWMLGRKFTTNRSKRFSFIVSLLAAIVAAVVSLMSWPLFFGVTYWVYDSLS